MFKSKLVFQVLVFPLAIYLAFLYFPIVSAQGEEELIEGQTLGLIDSQEKTLPHVQERFGLLASYGPPLSVEPVNHESAILIEKIGVNSPIVWDVPVVNRQEYEKALDQGAAHAQGTSHPKDLSANQSGNIYLFAHSTTNEALIARYAAVFTKIDELIIGDRIVVFENNKRYDYAVEKSEIVPSFDTTVLTRSFDHPTLTLQTCYPRGVPRDRLVVTARLVGVFDK